MKILKWVGDGSKIIPGFAPRDLTKDEIQARLPNHRTVNTVEELVDQLIATGLYAPYKATKSKGKE